ncbi:hypothetical protein FRB96_009682 [Tulasnella sp. 330]|nr:hypothetical protein FRB96_009682 [Tulasnella sp. 330]KAG8883316.1 hypothetical protein FRB97_006880 [Tulasnella sp. 331]
MGVSGAHPAITSAVTSSTRANVSHIYKRLSHRLIGTVLPLRRHATWIRFMNIIEVGSFGIIFLADEFNRNGWTGRQYAVKCLIRTPGDPHHDRFVLRERDLHAQVQHPNVVQVHGIIERREPEYDVHLVFIVMDYYPQGDLFKAIVDRQEYVGQDDKVRDTFLQLARGLQACHAQNVFHRDIKPENVLFHIECPGAYPSVAIADFGLATEETFSTEYGVGSCYYMSPECTDEQKVLQSRNVAYLTRPNDVWSMGVLLINLAVGRNPWCKASIEDDTFRGFTQNPDFLLSILPISLELNDVLKRIFRANVSERIGLDELIERVSWIDRFSMTWEELQSASLTVKNAAGPLWEVRRLQVLERAVTIPMVEPDVEYDHEEVMDNSSGSPESQEEEGTTVAGGADEDGSDDTESDEDREAYLAATTPGIYSPTETSNHSFTRVQTPSSPTREYIKSLFSGPESAISSPKSNTTLLPFQFQNILNTYGDSFENRNRSDNAATSTYSPALSDCDSTPSTPGGGPVTPGVASDRHHSLLSPTGLAGIKRKASATATTDYTTLFGEPGRHTYVRSPVGAAKVARSNDRSATVTPAAPTRCSLPPCISQLRCLLG